MDIDHPTMTSDNSRVKTNSLDGKKLTFELSSYMYIFAYGHLVHTRDI